MKNRYYKIVYIIPLLLLITLSIYGQLESIYFRSLRQGLSDQFVRCIFKDSKGFIWFGTQNGLTRYDGINMVIYENILDDTNSISYNNISTIFEDSKGNLWIGTFNGLNLYNRVKDNFIRIAVFDNIVISGICEDSDNNLWIGTIGKGLIKYYTEKNRIENFGINSIDINSNNSNHITCILTDHEGRLWVGTWNGLYLRNKNGNIVRHFVKESKNYEGLSDNYVNALSFENDSVLWIGTLYGGLDRLLINKHNFRFKNYLNKIGKYSVPSILTMTADRRNNLWIGLENYGLLRLNTKSGTINQYIKKEEGSFNSINSNLIRSLYIDDLDILWIGTIGKGVNYIDKRYKQFNIFKHNPFNNNSLCGEEVRCFAEDKNGNIWIATLDGICMYDIERNKFANRITTEKGLSTNAVTSIVFDFENNLWVGTLDKGIDRFDKNLIKTDNYKINAIQKVGENKINTLYVDKKNTLWVGTSGSGLFKYDKSKNSFIQIFNGLKGVGPNEFGYVFSVLETSDHKIWVGTAYRLFCLENIGNNKYSYKIFTSDNLEGSIKSNYIVTLFEDHNKKLWIGSIDHGLFQYDENRGMFISFDLKDGLPDNSILGISEDNEGNLWISTTNGISRFNISDKKFTNFTIDDGLVSEAFNANSIIRNKNGMLFFGSNEGFVSFYPEKISMNNSTQPVCLTDFKLFNQSLRIGVKGSPLCKSITETDKIVLKHYQSSFTIEFVALNYIQGSKSQYAYILEGLESNWNIVKKKNSASYSYVKPGKYLFKVKGSNNDGIWYDKPTTLEIVVLPPFWKSRLAYLLYIAASIFIIYTIIKFRISILKQIHLVQLNKMKLQFFADISHELRTPLSLIISPIENIFAYVSESNNFRHQLELIHKNAKRLYRLVDEIMYFYRATESKLTLNVHNSDIVKYTNELAHYFYEEAVRRQISFDFKSNLPYLDAWFDHEKYEKIILNLLSNAFKYTPDGGKISVKLEKYSLENLRLVEKENHIPKTNAKEFLKITISDNGKGIAADDINKIFDRFYRGNNEEYSYQEGTGIGLSLAKTLVELHHGKIYAISEIEKETHFIILLPLGNAHFKKSEIAKKPLDLKFKNEDDIEISHETPAFRTEVLQNFATVLIVEDNFDLRKYIVSNLSLKFKVLEAGDGDTGYKKAIEYLPDLIISDIIMPVLSGIDLCRQLKGNILTSHIPVVLLTAKTTLEDKLDGIETGADAYITKPFNIRYLEAVVRNLIETRKKLFQRFSQDVYIIPKEITNNPIDQHFLERLIEYIENNISRTELSVDELSTHLLLSPGHLWRKIKSLTGLTTNEFIRTIRLKKALHFMEEGNINIAEIAYRVGFSSPAYFTKCFKEQYGKPPSFYLINNKSG
jgi:ligand-binding sensor domain-containing protein/signal transduction histidine kinase/DNA-binding response OmpR family regulator